MIFLEDRSNYVLYCYYCQQSPWTDQLELCPTRPAAADTDGSSGSHPVVQGPMMDCEGITSGPKKNIIYKTCKDLKKKKWNYTFLNENTSCFKCFKINFLFKNLFIEKSQNNIFSSYLGLSLINQRVTRQMVIMPKHMNVVANGKTISQVSCSWKPGRGKSYQIYH